MKVKIGSRVFDLHLHTNVDTHPLGYNDAWGRTNFALGSIHVDGVGDSGRVTETIIHEILHCVFTIYGCKHHIPDNSIEEAVVDQMAKGLTQVLQDNPSLAELIGELLVMTNESLEDEGISLMNVDTSILN